MKNELEAKERPINPGNKPFERGEFLRYKSTTFSYHTGSEFIKIKCVFCSGSNHNPNRCVKVTNPSARKQIIFQQYLCYICMNPKYKNSNCDGNYVFKKYSGSHHISICQQGNLVRIYWRN